MSLRTATPILLALLWGCTGVMPTHFWDDFNSSLIRDNRNDQGPYGGHRATYWAASQPNAFSVSEVLSFAKNNGWEFADSLPYQDVVGSRTLFPLDHGGMDTTETSISTHAYFPLWIHGEATLYRFRTNWITVEPGTGETHDALSYVVIDRARQEMVVYHLWGE